MRLMAAATRSVAGGKRFRAMFCTWGFRAVRDPEPGEEAALLRAAAALELLHALDDDRPIRLLGVRAEMVPPEGGYEQPRTTGRGGPAARPPD